MAQSATFALKAGVWFRRGRLLIVSPDSLGTACPLSGRNSTYRPVQISGTGSDSRFRVGPKGDQVHRGKNGPLFKYLTRLRLRPTSCIECLQHSGWQGSLIGAFHMTVKSPIGSPSRF